MTRQISIVLPAYNEVGRLGDSLHAITTFCEREFDQWEVVVVDDGSTDRTAEVARAFPQVRCLQNETNRGKGYSVKRGILAARLDPILFTDVDLSAPIEEALSLYAAYEDGADVAIATRRIGGEKIVRRTLLRKLVSAVFKLCVRVLIIRGIDDTQCGFKLFRRDAARRIFPLQRLEGWAFDVEILYLARRLGCRIEQVLVEWHEASESRLGLLAPIEMFFDLLKIRRIHRAHFKRSSLRVGGRVITNAKGEGGRKDRI